MTKIQEQMKEFQHQLFAQDYYSLLYAVTLAKHEMMPVGVEMMQYSDAKIVDFANDFWLDLPDIPEIRRGPFWLLCDIAEHCFDEE